MRAGSSGAAAPDGVVTVVGRYLNLETLEAHVRDVAAPCAHQARVHRERLDRDERRDVGPAFMADGQVGADRVQGGKGVQRQASELDVGVEPIGECLRDALG